MRKRKTALFRRFLGADKGATAVVFGFMAVPVLALSAGVIDYGTAMQVKSELNATLDSAVLAATQAYALDNSVDTNKIVRDFIDKNYTHSGKTLLSSSITVSDPVIGPDDELTAKINVKVPTSFLKLVGFPEFDFDLSSSGKVGGQSLEVALVLDNTWSMNGAKLQSLKDSANILVDKLMINGNTNVKIALVPFADYVNIGVGNRFEPGLDIPAAYTVTNSWCDTRQTIQQCDSSTSTYACTKDGVPSTCTHTTQSNCQSVPNPNYNKCYDSHYDWYGCMGSRAHDLNVKDESYSTEVPGKMNTWNMCQQISPMTRLTSDKTVIKDGIAAMKANNSGRYTYIPTGLMWGWRAISDKTPFADGVAYSKKNVKKVIVLMTDGANTLTMRKWTGNKVMNHNGDMWGHDLRTDPAPQTDQYTKEVCDNIKLKDPNTGKDIALYTIAFDVPAGSSVETLMKDCAGNGGQYYDAKNSTQLANAFKQIAIALLNLRLSQ